MTELLEQNLEALRDELRSTRGRSGLRRYRQDLEDRADSLGCHRD